MAYLKVEPSKEGERPAFDKLEPGSLVEYCVKKNLVGARVEWTAYSDKPLSAGHCMTIQIGEGYRPFSHGFRGWTITQEPDGWTCSWSCDRAVGFRGWLLRAWLKVRGK